MKAYSFYRCTLFFLIVLLFTSVCCSFAFENVYSSYNKGQFADAKASSANGMKVRAKNRAKYAASKNKALVNKVQKETTNVGGVIINGDNHRGDIIIINDIDAPVTVNGE